MLVKIASQTEWGSTPAALHRSCSEQESQDSVVGWYVMVIRQESSFLAGPTSALNAHSEKYVQMAIDNASKRR